MIGPAFSCARQCAKLTPVTCPLCGQRKAKRACPAKGQTICPTCCATKRLREIDCPSDCSHLAAARAHPPAVVQRQRERDSAFVMGLVNGLDEGQMVMVSLAQQHLQRYRPTAIPALADADVLEAAKAVAATLETAARGIVYEHSAPSLPAQRLVAMFRALEAEVATHRRLSSRSVAIAFRRLEQAARTADERVGGGATAFLDFVDRLAAGSPGRAPSDEGPPAASGSVGGDPERRDQPRIILP